MTNQEFSNEFDVLYNNIMSNQAPGLDEYEKSVFLTKAQDEIVKNYFNPKGNKFTEGFDGNEKRQIDFSMLIKTSIATEVTGVASLFPLGHTKFFAVPDRVMMFINESLAVQRGDSKKYLSVVPLNYNEYSRLMSKPYKRPLKNQAWRIITNTKVNSTETITEYGTIASMLASLLNVDYTTVYNTINGQSLSWTGNNLRVGSGTLCDNGTTTGAAVEFTAEQIADFNQHINKTISTLSAVVEIIPGPIDTIDSYTIRYIARPKAIILSKLEGVTLDNQTAEQECELDPILHQEILQRAVELAKAAYTGDVSTSVELGKRSE